MKRRTVTYIFDKEVGIEKPVTLVNYLAALQLSRMYTNSKLYVKDSCAKRRVLRHLLRVIALKVLMSVDDAKLMFDIINENADLSKIIKPETVKFYESIRYVGSSYDGDLTISYKNLKFADIISSYGLVDLTAEELVAVNKAFMISESES